MSPERYAWHARRVERMLVDLDLDANAVICDTEFALTQGYTRRLTPPLHNQTLGEGLSSALVIAAAKLKGEI